ncbi:hypothetical protein CRG98_020390 [Punica granatum]|uniref:Reverse transcriptase domain-containing protein n=1 Tax=Punica granatum TaxID=22663 RepID=A0A2I0JSD3_PUNGR|nr:hypothetical protein CRG98_020390 [Punica granatum]
MEILSRLLYRAESNGDIKGIQISRGGPQITHLMFADDLLILAKASPANIIAIKDILDKFCQWSGQEINSSKSGLFFSKNTTVDSRRSAKSILGIRKLKENARYLGNPMFIKRKRKESFQFLIDKIKNRLAAWKTKALSWARRATLIRSVINSTPIYTMSLFRLPKSTLNTIDKVTRRFWWGSTKEEGNFYAPRNWGAICQPKAKGGLGFRRAEDSNKAMLSKTAWALTKGNGSLAGRAFKAKYGNFLNSPNCPSASPIWKGLQWCKDTIQASTCFSIGNGSSTSAWLDPWIPGTVNFKPTPRVDVFQDPALKVRDLMLFNPKRWNIPLISSLFEHDSVHNILKIHLSQTDFEDSAKWTPNSSGKHSIKSFYLTDQQHRFHDHSEISWKAIWNLKIHERFKLHLWRIGSESLP